MTRSFQQFETRELLVELIALKNVPASAWTLAHSIRERELQRELDRRRPK